MLDNVTKKNIDDCRDVLVGKVPDPKSQIEQITIALIYKFMDDMDKEAVEKFKGKLKFFAPPKKTGDPKVDKKLIDYSKYGWRKLFDPKLGGKEMLELYSEALDKLQTNPNIPELFRNIFKNAYLPYRDPSTLKLFLKYINEFEYSHSEKLGDAFEYLLSVMGSQGDAGQFRTPRHIIDFVTACVNPQKNETVLDPACGTAGFLLSAYKHILKQNTEKRQGDKLTPDQRKKLATNFVGYDISPDMVRLSLANMYLHGFATPQIHEYDSLSSEDRWNETFDVILATPPFMTPKGGIRPHKKFGVQVADAINTDYEIVKLEDVCDFIDYRGKTPTKTESGIRLITAKNVKKGHLSLEPLEYIAEADYESWMTRGIPSKGDVLITTEAPLGNVAQIDTDEKIALAQRIITLIPKSDNLDKAFLKNALLSDQVQFELNGFATGSTVLGIKSSSLKDISIPFPPLEIQQQIVAEIEGYQKIIDGAKQVVNNYKPTITIKPEWEMVQLGTIGKICMCKRVFKEQTTDKGDVPFYKIGTFGGEPDAFISQELFNEYQSKFSYPKKGDILISTSGTIGKTVVFEGRPAYFQDSNIVWIANDETKILNTFLKIYYQVIRWRPSEGVTIARLYNKIIEETQIPLPSLEEQQTIVKAIEEEMQLVSANKRIIEIFEQKIKTKISEVWGEKASAYQLENEKLSMNFLKEPFI